MKPLPISMTVSLGEGESPMSFCSRNALLLGRTARDFSLDMGFTFQGIVDGNPSALEELAFRCRADVGRLAAASVTRIGDRRYSIGGQSLVRDTLSRKSLRVCPHCLLEDIGNGDGLEAVRPYGRTLWLVAPIRTCPKHDVGLVEVSDDHNPQRVHDFARLVQPSLPDLGRLVREAPRRRPSALEEYLTARLQGRNGDGHAAWLQTLPFYAAAKACEMLGAVVIHGIRFRAERLSDTEWHEAGAAGYEIAAGGEQGIRSLLSRLQDGFPLTKGNWGPRLVIGRIYEWLAHESEDPAYDPLRDVIRRHVIETMPVGPGDKIFGQDVTVRRLHSVHSASREIGAHPKRLRKLLHAAGHIAADVLHLSDERIVFDANTTCEFLNRVSETMSLEQARDYLNAPRPHERLLFEAEYIRPFVAGGTEGVIRDHAFARRDLDAFLDRLLADAVPVGLEDRSFLPIPAAAKRACCSAMEIVGLIMDRKLPRVRCRVGVVGYLSVLVDPEEVKPFVSGKDHGGLTLREVERRLGSSTAVVKALTELGHLPSHIVVNPVNRCPQRVVHAEDVDRFMRRFVSLHTLSAETGIHFIRLANMLDDAGIEPAFEPGTVRASFYERRDVVEQIAIPAAT
ncbi:TniQ family protein [Microvirga massiliensis]|uniref:TniQ family protein n=1 Tax=Microvirga massiliensis TaxID=1033741 RepID=UPI0006605864|nr:TniQ family protein [Microvirga massiliensis]